MYIPEMRVPHLRQHCHGWVEVGVGRSDDVLVVGGSSSVDEANTSCVSVCHCRLNAVLRQVACVSGGGGCSERQNSNLAPYALCALQVMQRADADSKINACGCAYGVVSQPNPPWCVCAKCMQ
jgi:hypothetical protein